METIKVYAQHEENKKWMNNLLFYRDEIKVMENRLSEIANKNTSKDVLALVEKFQNQLIIQNDTIDTLKHELNLSEDSVACEITKNKIAVDHRDIARNVLVEQNLASFEKNFQNLKTSLNLFLSKWM